MYFNKTQIERASAAFSSAAFAGASNIQGEFSIDLGNLNTITLNDDKTVA
jgi:hypothetical protein